MYLLHLLLHPDSTCIIFSHRETVAERLHFISDKKITVKAALALREGCTHSESVGGRGAGTLLLVGRTHTVTAYYRYTGPDGKRPWVDLGTLGEQFGIGDARVECHRLWQLRREHPYLKEHLIELCEIQRQQIAEAKRKQIAEASLATMKDLLEDYVTYLKDQGKQSAVTVERAFESVVFTAHPDMAKKRACDIEPDDIVNLIKPLSRAGHKVYRNRVRSYLHAAFKYGLDREYDETRSSSKSFSLKSNPVTPIPVLKNVDTVGTRSLKPQELSLFYHQVEQTPSVGIVMATLMRFLIATVGQRPSQVLRVRWSDYNLEQRYFKIIDLKGRGSQERVHLVPLTDRAISLLEYIRPVTGEYQWPFSYTGEAPISIQSLKNVSQRFIAHQQDFERFTVRDLRRSCKQVMTEAKIPREHRNLLQNHGMTGVDIKHYDNDPTAHLTLKTEAMQRYDRALATILGEHPKNNVVALPR